MWTLSKESDKICERIISIRLHADMLDNLKWETMSAATLRQSEVKTYFAKALINILHNAVRNQTARVAFRKCNAVNIVQKFREVKDNPVICYFVAIIAKSSCIKFMLITI